MADPRGVVAVLTMPSGSVIAHAADFDEGGYGGFTLLEAQRLRARGALARAYVEAVSHPDLAAVIDTHRAKDIISNLTRHHGYTVTEIPIGHAPEDL